MLEGMVQRYPSDARLLRMLSTAAGKGGDPMLGQLYLAEANYQVGNLETAVQQLEVALRSRDLEYYLSAKMAARLKEMAEELGINCGYNAMGQGNMANATIGRAIRFILTNIGGKKADETVKALQQELYEQCAIK